MVIYSTLEAGAGIKPTWTDLRSDCRPIAASTGIPESKRCPQAAGASRDYGKRCAVCVPTHR